MLYLKLHKLFLTLYNNSNSSKGFILEIIIRRLGVHINILLDTIY